MKNILLTLLIFASCDLFGQQNTDYEINNSYGTTGRARLLMNISDRNWQIENDGYYNIFKIRDQSAPADRFAIDYNGNIGIGTIQPTHKLDVRGHGVFKDGSIVDIAISTPGGKNGIVFSPNTYGNYSRFNLINFDNTNTNDRYFKLNFNDDPYGIAIRNGGNVGIGTNSPTSLLHLNSSTQNTDINISNTNGSSGRNRILMNIADRAWHIENDGNLNLFKIRDQTAASDRLVINYNGNVGIGTSNPDSNYKLSVNGSIRSKEVKVEANWSDFVFYNDYKLRTLEEVEEHIAEKGHLPEIPNEAEVTENGINLGEMNAKLLQKIEELTLYMIDMNKRMKQVETENRELKGKVKSLENE